MRVRALLASAVLALVAGACARGKDSSDPGRAPPGLSLDEYEHMLARNEAALREQGVSIPGPGGTQTTVALAPEVDGSGLDEDDAPAAGATGSGVTTSRPAASPAKPETVTETAPMTPPRPEPDPDPFPAVEAEQGPADQTSRVRNVRSGDREQKQDRQPGIDRCETICELAAATCDLEGKICGLAQHHPTDPRYQNACARATRDCDIAEEACVACAG